MYVSTIYIYIGHILKIYDEYVCIYIPYPLFIPTQKDEDFEYHTTKPELWTFWIPCFKVVAVIHEHVDSKEGGIKSWRYHVDLCVFYFFVGIRINSYKFIYIQNKYRLRACILNQEFCRFFSETFDFRSTNFETHSVMLSSFYPLGFKIIYKNQNIQSYKRIVSNLQYLPTMYTVIFFSKYSLDIS